jgi:hypothetical protein
MEPVRELSNSASLPPELLLRILYFVDVPDLLAISRVGRPHKHPHAEGKTCSLTMRYNTDMSTSSPALSRSPIASAAAQTIARERKIPAASETSHPVHLASDLRDLLDSHPHCRPAPALVTRQYSAEP